MPSIAIPQHSVLLFLQTCLLFHFLYFTCCFLIHPLHPHVPSFKPMLLPHGNWYFLIPLYLYTKVTSSLIPCVLLYWCLGLLCVTSSSLSSLQPQILQMGKSCWKSQTVSNEMLPLPSTSRLVSDNNQEQICLPHSVQHPASRQTSRCTHMHSSRYCFRNAHWGFSILFTLISEFLWQQVQSIMFSISC